MRNSLFLTTIASLLFCAACTNENAGGLSATAQKNLDASRAITKMFETADFSKIGDYIAADAVDHAGPMGDVKGLDSMKAAFEGYLKMASNVKNEIIKELADDEYVMVWLRQTGTMNVADMGLKPGDKFDWETVEVSKYKDGKATEHWSFVNMSDMMETMQKMGQGMPMPAATDAKPATSTVK